MRYKHPVNPFTSTKTMGFYLSYPLHTLIISENISQILQVIH
jgi:hypothetical protein